MFFQEPAEGGRIMVRRNTTHGLQQVTNSGRRTEARFHEHRATATGRVRQDVVGNDGAAGGRQWNQ